jgi:CubicO group peptidase (beta-lactamase class C family)
MTSNHAGSLYEEGHLGFGFGFEVVEDPGRAGRVAAPGEFAWGSGYDGGYFVDPRDGVLALYLAQRTPERGPRQRRLFSALVYQSLVGGIP